MHTLEPCLFFTQSHFPHRHPGDPEQVTVGGQSAGAYLACLLMAMPEPDGKRKPFRALVMESGGCYAQPLSLAQERTAAWAEEVGCASSSDDPAASLACLRALPLEALVPSSSRRGQEEYHYWQPTVVGGEGAPTPLELLAADEGLRRSMVLIVGTNEDEGTLFLPPTGLLDDDSDAAYAEWVVGGAMERGQGFPFLKDEVRIGMVCHLSDPSSGRLHPISTSFSTN